MASPAHAAFAISLKTAEAIVQSIFILLFLLQAAPLNVAWGMSNPASEFCIKNGGKLEIRKGPGGEYGLCRLPDGREIEEWAYYRASRGKRR